MLIGLESRAQRADDASSYFPMCELCVNASREGPQVLFLVVLVCMACDWASLFLRARMVRTAKGLEICFFASTIKLHGI